MPDTPDLDEELVHRLAASTGKSVEAVRRLLRSTKGDEVSIAGLIEETDRLEKIDPDESSTEL